MSELGLSLISCLTVSTCLNNASLVLIKFSYYFNTKFAQIFYIGFGSDDKVIYFIFLTSFELIYFYNLAKFNVINSFVK